MISELKQQLVKVESEDGRLFWIDICSALLDHVSLAANSALETER